MIAIRTRFLSQALLAVTLGILCGESAHAIPQPLQVKPNRIVQPLETGSLIGGTSGTEFSLLAVKTEDLKNKSGERFVISYGDRDGKPLKGQPGFFQIALDKESKRIVIDLAQVSKTAVAPQQLAKILSQSRYVAASDMTTDPQDGTTNITLDMKNPVKMSVRSVNEGESQVIIEVSPLTSAK